MLERELASTPLRTGRGRAGTGLTCTSLLSPFLLPLRGPPALSLLLQAAPSSLLVSLGPLSSAPFSSSLCTVYSCSSQDREEQTHWEGGQGRLAATQAELGLLE